MKFKEYCYLSIYVPKFIDWSKENQYEVSFLAKQIIEIRDIYDGKRSTLLNKKGEITNHSIDCLYEAEDYPWRKIHYTNEITIIKKRNILEILLCCDFYYLNNLLINPPRDVDEVYEYEELYSEILKLNISYKKINKLSSIKWIEVFKYFEYNYYL